MPKRRRLNQADIQKMEELLIQNKRSEMYKFYYRFTGIEF